MYRFLMVASARIGLRILALILLALALIYIALLFTFPSEKFRSWAQSELSQRGGLDVQLGSLSLRFPFRLVAENVKISQAPGFLLTAERLTATLNPLDLPTGILHRLRVEKPVLRLDLQQLPESKREAGAPLALRSLNVHDGTIVLTRGDQDVLQLPHIDLQAENINLGGQTGVTLRTDVPAVNAVAEVIVKGYAHEIEAAALVRAKSPRQLKGGGLVQSSADELLRLEVKIRAPDGQRTEATIDGKFDGLGLEENRFTGSVAARIEVDPTFKSAAFTGHASLEDFPGALTPPVGKLPRGEVQASFAGAFALPEKKLALKSLRLASHLGSATGAGEVLFDPQPTISRAKLRWQEIPLASFQTLLPQPLSGWLFQGRAQIDTEIRGPWFALEIRGTARSDDLQVRGHGLKAAKLAMVLPFAWTAPAVRIEGARLEVAKLDYNGFQAWQAGAESLRATGSFTTRSDQPLTISGQFESAGGRFNAPGNDKVGEGLALKGSFAWTSGTKTRSHRLDVKLAVDRGEILWGKLFTDLKMRKPVFAVDADYHETEDRLDCRRCEIRIESIGSVTASGTIRRLTGTPELGLQVRSEKLLPGGFFAYFVRENFNRRFPLLDQLAVGGELAFAAQLRGSADDLNATGELSLKGGELRSLANEWQVGPLALNLPFDIRSAASKQHSLNPPHIGVLEIERARFGTQLLGPIRAPISLSRNALRLHQPLRAAAFGGEIVVRDLFWPDLFSDPKRLSFSLETQRLQLDDLTQSLDWPRFSGTLTASIPEVQSTSDALKTAGAIRAELFGGRMTMNRLEIENPFSSLAAIRLDADLRDIRLEQLSKTFAFGHISGILAGTIDDLVIVDGQPAQFRAELYSVDRGGEQRISVEALNKITVLSSGQNAGALYGGLSGFFDSFRYSKLGFKAALRNDRLTLRGVESRGNEEYLVVGSFLPPTVNIVSHTQVIAFSELLRRLERIKSEQPEVK